MNNFDYFIISNFILVLSLTLIFNLKNKIFLGNNGAYLISFFIGVFLIKLYNQSLSSIEFGSDRIFLMLMIPGIDMLDCSFFRILNKKNPLSRDQNHLHHYLKKSFQRKSFYSLCSSNIFANNNR